MSISFLSFLLLLPRQIISDSIGTCYEEYVQDANRHYKVIKKFHNEKCEHRNWNWNFFYRIGLQKPPHLIGPLKPYLVQKNVMICIRPGHRFQCLRSTGNCIRATVALLWNNFTKGLYYVYYFCMWKTWPSIHTNWISLSLQFYRSSHFCHIRIYMRSYWIPNCQLHAVQIPFGQACKFWHDTYCSKYHGSKGSRNEFRKQRNVCWLIRPLLGELDRKKRGWSIWLSNFSFLFCVYFSETYEEQDHLFESLVALEEFCKELAAIAFVKYHHATE